MGGACRAVTLLLGGSGARFGLLGAVLAAALVAVLDALGVQGTAHDVVTHTGKVLHTAAANEHDAVFLQVVAFAGDVRGDFKAAGQAHTGDLTKRRVGLLGGGGLHDGAHATAEGAALQGRDLALFLENLAALAQKLLGGRQNITPVSLI